MRNTRAGCSIGSSGHWAEMSKKKMEDGNRHVRTVVQRIKSGLRVRNSGDKREEEEAGVFEHEDSSRTLR